MRSGKDGTKGPPGGDKTPPTHTKDRDMGSALRSVWQKTVEEKVPDDMIDLLGKLG